MRLSVKKIVAVCINLAILVLSAVWIEKNIKADVLIMYVNSFQAEEFALPIVLYSTAILFYSLRFRRLANCDFGVSFQVVNLGAGLNIILPFRLGDLARIYYARTLFSLSAAKLLAVTIVEKYLDLSAVGFLLSIAISLGAGDLVNVGVGIFGLLIIVLIFLIVVFVMRYSDLFEAAIEKIKIPTSWIKRLRESIPVGRISQIIGLTVLSWLANVLMVLSSFMILLPSSTFSIIDSISILVITALAIALPGAPAGLGVFEAGVVAYLIQALGVESEPALACAIVFHAVMVVPQLVITAICLAKRWLIGG